MSKLVTVRLGLVLLFSFVLLATPAAASPALDTNVWSGEYYNNTTLAGPPVLLRGDPNLDFFWPENASPAPGVVNTNNYSVRWTRLINFTGNGNWVFTTVNDDGMRVWVDDVITMDAWYDQGPTTHIGTIYLSAGWHLVKVEYYNRAMAGTARVSWSLEGSFTDWKGEYFDNQSLSGSPTLTRNDANINFNWGAGSPDPSIPVDHFSVRWTRTLYFSGGTWRFTTASDDGVRLWIDGSLLIDKWFDQSYTAYTADIVLGAGNHTVRLEYYDSLVAAAVALAYGQVTNTVPTPTPVTTYGVWHGQYFNNPWLAGPVAFIRDDPSLHFDWGTGSPAPNIPVDNFSVKWDSTQWLPITGNYTVLVSSDDGVRVWIDGALVIDAWYDHSPTLFSTVRYLGAGAHNVHVEYYEHTVTAMVGVDLLPGTPPPPPPPSGDVIVDDRATGWQSGGSATGWLNTPNGYGGHAFWTFNNAYTAPYYNWARWYPPLARAGYYEVFAYIPPNTATTINARYWVYHNSRYDLAPRAQVFYSNQWMSLGTYYFNAQGGENVSLADVTYECYLCRTLAYDAIKFSPR
jgi:hypothetical protein